MTEQYQKSRASTEREFTRFGERVLLGDGIRNGIDPPEVLEPDVLLRGKVHIIYSGPGNGKTMLALWLAKRCMQRRARVVLFDTENGVRTVSERLADLGVNPNRVDKYLWYYPDPTLPVSDSAKQAYEAFLDRVEPTLVIFDSLISFLAGAGLSENENTDIARWATVYAHPARARHITTVILDHVPHDDSHARGATRKKDEVDVMWRLRNPKPFDRQTVGEITLLREKDREGWLPLTVLFSVGGSENGITFSRSDGTLEMRGSIDGLTDSQRRCLIELRAAGDEGLRFNEWLNRAKVAKGTLSTAAKVLVNLDFCYQGRDGRYHYIEPRFNGGSIDQLNRGDEDG